MSAITWARASYMEEEYTEYVGIGGGDIQIQGKTAVRGRLLSTSEICMIALGSVPILVGTITGLWPVALAGLGPWLLVLIDSGIRWRKKRQAI